MLLWGHGAAFHGLLITISGKCYERGWRLYRAARTNVCRRPWTLPGGEQTRGWQQHAAMDPWNAAERATGRGLPALVHN